MAGLRLLGVICAAIAVALLLDAAVCLLPENDYQRWQLQDDAWRYWQPGRGRSAQGFSDPGSRLRWIYERIHFDLKPIDVAILGTSRAQVGLSSAAIEESLASRGEQLQVANLALGFTGRNIESAIVDELYKAKSPKVIVLEVHDRPYPFGHMAFKYVASADAIVSPPTLFLHNYMYDLAYLPARKLKLFGANIFPGLFGLAKQFDPELYARVPTDYSTNFLDELGKTTDMEHSAPPKALLAETRPVPETLITDAFTWINGGEDHLYIRKIASEAKAHGTKLIFIYMPVFDGSKTMSDVDFLKQYGPIVNNGDLVADDELFMSWTHMDHAGAMKASARLANAIDGLNLPK
jgi:hypothetical protein